MSSTAAPDPEVRTGEELMDLTAALSRVVRRLLRNGRLEPRLRGAHVELLHIIAAKPGIGVRSAARVLHLADNSVSTLVNQLVSAGLVTRTPAPEDRRVAHLEITDAARRRLAAWRRRRAELAATVFADLPPEDVSAIAAALPALRRVVSKLADTATSEE
jgi:DNA-binding MarR family transcriptional regulator